MTVLTIGAHVETPHGAGTVTGWHRTETWLNARTRLTVFAVVELDQGGRRLIPIGEVTTTDNDAGEPAGRSTL